MRGEKQLEEGTWRWPLADVNADGPQELEKRHLDIHNRCGRAAEMGIRYPSKDDMSTRPLYGKKKR